jgi:heptosyltransferase-2
MNMDTSGRPVKILVIRLSSMGDILLSTPLLRQIKAKYKKAEIDFVVKKRFAGLLRFNPHLTRVIEFDEGDKKNNLKALRMKLRAEHYDAVLDLHNNWRSNFLRLGLQAPYKQHVHKDKIRQVCLVYGKKNRYRKITPIPLRYLQVGKGLDIADDGRGLEIYWDHAVEQEVRELLRERNFEGEAGTYLCLAPGAGFFTKRWPAEYFQSLVKMILQKSEKRIIIMGGAEDRYLHEIFPSGGRLLNLAGELELLHSAVVLSGAQGLVVNDTGLMHMATAVNTPVTAIFGSTVEELGFFPFRGKSSVVQIGKLYCRPCSHMGRNRCPEKHFRCMREIQPETVFNEFNRLTASPRSSTGTQDN